MTHSTTLRAARNAVVAAAKADLHSVCNDTKDETWWCAEGHIWECPCAASRRELHSATARLEALEAQTCETCGGMGKWQVALDGRGHPVTAPCPAGCDEGRKR